MNCKEMLESAAEVTLKSMSTEDVDGFVADPETWRDGLSMQPIGFGPDGQEIYLGEKEWTALRDALLRRIPMICEECGEPRRTRVCCVCGDSRSVIDCGHHPQPAYISAGPDGRDYCDKCYG